MKSSKSSACLWLSALALTLAAASRAGQAQETPQPHRLFRLSSCLTCRQSAPSVAGNPAGDVMATWTAARNVSNHGVYNRLFNASLSPLDSDFLVLGAASTAPQFDGAVATDADGNFVVAWSSLASDQSTILVRRFNPAGRPLGPAVEVDTAPSSSPGTPAEFNPTVAAVPGGGFVVAWVALPSGGAPGGPPRVLSRRFDANAVARGAAVQLSTGLAFGDRPSLCVSSTGRVHAAWTVADAYRPFEPSLAGVVVRRLSENDVPLGPEQVISPAVDEESSVAIACGPGNTYVVAWQTAQAPAAAGGDIVARRFTRIGRALGTPTVVNQTTAGTQKNPSILADANGGFVVVWEGNPGGMNGVTGRRFGNDGVPLSDDFPVYRAGQGDLTVLQPTLAALGPAGFIVAMNGPDGGAVGRSFSLSSNAANAASSDLTAPAEAADTDEVADTAGGLP